MNSSNLVNLYKTIEKHRMNVWIDGGWGIDALLEKQSREHDDLDIVVQKNDLNTLTSLLYSLGYKDLLNKDTKPWNFILIDENKNKIDIHVIVFDDQGNGIYGPQENNAVYPAYAFESEGLVENTLVRCITPKYQLESHTGYKLRRKDIQDVIKLCNRFNLPIPDSFNNI